MPTLDLAEPYLSGVRAVFAENAPGVWAWAYGSRVRGTNHPASDLDLVVRGPGGAAVSPLLMGRLRGAFEESNLPLIVDLLDWSRLPERFRQEIERGCVLVVSGESAGDASATAPASPRMFG